MAREVLNIDETRTTADAERSSLPLPRQSMLGQLLLRPIQLFAVVSGVALIVALGILVTISWRGLQRLEPFYQHLEQQQGLEHIEREIEDLLALHYSGRREPSSTDLAGMRERLTKLIAAHAFSNPSTSGRLRDAIGALAEGPGVQADPEMARTRVQEALDSERAAQRASLKGFRQGARAELILAASALLVLPCTAILVLLILRERISRPLRDLNELLALIGKEQYQPAPAGDAAFPIRPIMESYNRLVERLTTALKANKRHQEQLQCQVRAAAETLVRQRLELAEADRLAAVGETSARVAHELRNPLAGIQVGLANLTQDCAEPDQRERLQLIAAEVARMARLLDLLLKRSSRQPESLQEVEIQSLVSDLLALARYQIPDRIACKNNTPKELRCRVQRDAMRQMLLNLVLNASQAIGVQTGTISVAASRDGSLLRLSVLDDGPGFPPDLLEGGIRPFQTRREGGSGLGLSTVQRMARAAGGELELANSNPHGAVATLVLPANGAC